MKIRGKRSSPATQPFCLQYRGGAVGMNLVICKTEEFGLPNGDEEQDLIFGLEVQPWLLLLIALIGCIAFDVSLKPWWSMPFPTLLIIRRSQKTHDPWQLEWKET